jgi:hypothetical protein
LGIDPAALRQEASCEEDQQADVGDHEAGLMPLPGIADRRRAEDAHRQQGVEEREPPGVPDAELHRLGAVGALDERPHPEDDGQRRNQHHCELQRREELIDGEHAPHDGGLIGRDEPACCHG